MTTSVDAARRTAVARCVLGSFTGTEAPAWLLDRVRDGLGGVLLFAGNVVDDAQVGRLVTALRSARDDVVVAIDEEGGDVTRLDAATGSLVPSPAAFGAVDDVVRTRAAHGGLAARLRTVGIDLVLAPCADVNSNPRNPVIGVRSFGSSPSLVARHVEAAVRGAHDSGVAVCAKHFPGHGDTVADTHRGPARVDASMATLHDRELVSFRSAIVAGADAVLTAHVVVPALDHLPVSLSRMWTDHLRQTMGFRGAIVTDALDMDAVAGGRGLEGVADAAVAALVAGADLLCLGSAFDEASTDRVLDALVAAPVDVASLEASAARVRALRRPPSSDPADGPSDLRGPEPAAASAASSTVARDAIRIDGPLPPPQSTVVECRPAGGMANFDVTWGLAGPLAAVGWRGRSVCVSAGSDGLPLDDHDRDVVVVVRDLGVHTWQLDVIAACRSRAATTTVVELGWPGPRPSDATTWIVTHGAALASTQALARLLADRPEHPTSDEDVHP